MGNAHFAPLTPGARMRYFALDFKVTILDDELYVIYNCDTVVPIIKESINKMYENGISDEKRITETIHKIETKNVVIKDFKEGKDFLVSQRLLCLIFEDLLRAGWKLIASSNIRRDVKRCTLFFEQDTTAAIPSEGPLLAVCLKSDDKLYLCNAETAIRDLVGAEIQRNWAGGIQDAEQYNETECKFKFNGFPWCVDSFSPAVVETRCLILNLMQALEQRGFQFYAASHPVGQEKAADTMYFTRHQQITPTGETFVFGLLKENIIYLVRAPDALRSIVQQCIETHWKYGIDSIRDLPSLVYIKLNLSPWTMEGKDRMRARLLIVHLFEEMRRNGWQIHATLDLSYIYDDVSCFVMKSAPPVSHRFCAVSLNSYDRLRLLNAPPEIQDIFTDLRREWSKKLKNDKEWEDCPGIILPGFFSECIGIFCLIFDRMKTRGWNIVSSADLQANFKYNSDEQHSKDYHTLIFEEEGASSSEAAMGFKTDF